MIDGFIILLKENCVMILYQALHKYISFGGGDYTFGLSELFVLDNSDRSFSINFPHKD